MRGHRCRIRPQTTWLAFFAPRPSFRSDATTDKEWHQDPPRTAPAVFWIYIQRNNTHRPLAPSHSTVARRIVRSFNWFYRCYQFYPAVCVSADQQFTKFSDWSARQRTAFRIWGRYQFLVSRQHFITQHIVWWYHQPHPFLDHIDELLVGYY